MCLNEQSDQNDIYLLIVDLHPVWMALLGWASVLVLFREHSGRVESPHQPDLVSLLAA